ncbi:MAG TPA: SdrD B-like domain-containing protein [Dehalococcoidia bacterium]|nr:SdrD B-like domain-containing protein [Dehalococcoidia bacterium]
MRRVFILLTLTLALTTALLLPKTSSGQTPTLRIFGVVWQDDNADGIRQAQERGIGLAEVRLTGPMGELPATKTDSGGHYLFTDLSAGAYQLNLGGMVPGMWSQTAPKRETYPPAAVQVVLGTQSILTIDFGLFPMGGVPQFSGSAWINAEPAPKPEVRAYIGSADCTLPSSLLLATDPEPVSRYEITVAPAAFVAGCGTEGATITFTVNGRRANETAIWERMPVEQLPPGTIPQALPPPPAVLPQLAGRRQLMLTVGPPFAAYFDGVIDERTGERLETGAPPRFASVHAYVSDVLCGSIVQYGFSAMLVVPSEQLRPGCGREGAVVRFIVDGAPAPEQLPWKPGSQQLTLTLGSNAGVPPGVFRVVVSGETLNLPVSRAATGADTLGQALGSLTVLADGTTCLGVEVSGARGDVVLEVGRPGQPAACTTDGAAITFVDGRGRRLSTQMTLRKGTQQTLANVAPLPPGSVPATAPQTQPASTIRPPDTGDAGLIVR